MKFPVMILPTGEAGFTAIAPDLNGCDIGIFSTIDETIEGAQNAIQLLLEERMKKGRKLPRMKPIERHWEKLGGLNRVWIVVDIDLSRLSSKTVRVGLTLPERVLSLIDAAATRTGKTRSGFLCGAAMREVQRELVA